MARRADAILGRRYRVSDEVEHGCCYKATVVDTATRRFEGMEGFEDDDEPAFICECFDKETAQMIADAMNAREKQGG